MSTYLSDPAVIANPDGSYSIPDPAHFDGWGVWTLRDTGEGWTATHPHDGFNADDPTDVPRWATAEDAAHAVLDDPTTARRWAA